MIDMTKNVPVDLQKKEQLVTAMLRERGMREAPVMRVALALDVSGSMRSVIDGGDLQKAVDQIGGVAIKFDDNGQIDVWTFNHQQQPVGAWKPEDYGTYVADKRIRAGGGTSYAPVMRSIVASMFPTNKSWFGRGGESDEPVLAIMITDGESDDADAARRVVEENAKRPIYWMLVGVGSERFQTLSELGDQYDNVGFVKLAGFGLTDQQVYNELINEELVEFLKRF